MPNPAVDIVHRKPTHKAPPLEPPKEHAYPAGRSGRGRSPPASHPVTYGTRSHLCDSRRNQIVFWICSDLPFDTLITLSFSFSLPLCPLYPSLTSPRSCLDGVSCLSVSSISSRPCPRLVRLAVCLRLTCQRACPADHRGSFVISSPPGFPD